MEDEEVKLDEGPSLPFAHRSARYLATSSSLACTPAPHEGADSTVEVTGEGGAGAKALAASLVALVACLSSSSVIVHRFIATTSALSSASDIRWIGLRQKMRLSRELQGLETGRIDRKKSGF